MFELIGLSGVYDLIFQMILLGAMLGFFMHWIGTIEGQWWVDNKLFKRPSVIRVKMLGGRAFYMDLIKGKKQKKGGGIPFFGKKDDQPKPADDKLLIDTLASDAPIARRIGSNSKYVFQFHDQPMLFDPWNVEQGRYEITEEAKQYFVKAQGIAEELKAMQGDLDAAYEAKDQQRIEAITKVALAKRDEYEELIHTGNNKRGWLRLAIPPIARITGQYMNELSDAKAKIYSTFLKQLESKWNMIFLFSIASAIASGLTAILYVLQRFGK